MLHRSRLVTLTGPAGVGKTRTAIELGHSQARQRADGVWFVDLASVSRTEDVAAEAARVLDIRGATRDATTDAVRRYLADRDVLLMLDNCEHVLDTCTELGMTLLGACPQLRILATSREPLGITGEAVWRLEPLQPEHAYRLFLERARERSPQLIPDEDTEAAIFHICARVDQLPLGVELAAARISIMSPNEIITSLDAHVGELGRPRRPTPAHHRSVRAAVEWSYDLLHADEKSLLHQVAVHRGGASLPSLHAVGASEGLDQATVTYLLGVLVEPAHLLLDLVHSLAHPPDRVEHSRRRRRTGDPCERFLSDVAQPAEQVLLALPLRHRANLTRGA